MTSQYGALICMLDKQGYTRARACTCPRTSKHARADTLTICNTYCFSTTTMIRESASVLRYSYIVCLVDPNLS